MPIIESNGAPEEPPCDFVAYLAQRLGIGHDVALSKLCAWLVEYDCNAASYPRGPGAAAVRAER